ncbi:mechanosensitive ion channel domain-containing protein [Salinarchaeum laminariae]|uniref:mechanosensitive ion channel domain-containing protein n=1 Tax=Salinarchaeum laminariae TaxID=869888 RepID=UPI0020BD7ACD|nr:mechanosensitive ion channel domain-containing protein [Salinarchaeum laminariae]
MAFDPGSFASEVADTTGDRLATWVETSVPTLVRVLILLVLAYVGIKITLFALRRVLGRIYGEREALVVDLAVTIVGIFLWFSVALSLLSILGMGEIAASMGTTTGFVALGVAYALSEMIEDTVAGIYLLRDPDFEVGDRVVTEKGEGVVRAIELRKCRLEQADGSMLVVANGDVEKKWTRKETGNAAEDADPT